MFPPNLSLHKTLLCNNSDITVRNKSLFYPSWPERNVNSVLDVFDYRGNILSYEQFITLNEFPIFFRVFSAIPSGLTTLMKTHLNFGDDHRTYPELSLEGVGFLQKSYCNNIRQFTPRGKHFWFSWHCL
jgi:hypothetical protein